MSILGNYHGTIQKSIHLCVGMIRKNAVEGKKSCRPVDIANEMYSK